MEFSQLTERADDIKRKYAELNHANEHRQWGVAEYAQGFVGDVGALVKLIMARNGYLAGNDLDNRIAHELVDCLWSVLVIAKELGIDLEAAFIQEMETLEQRISGKLSERD